MNDYFVPLQIVHHFEVKIDGIPHNVPIEGDRLVGAMYVYETRDAAMKDSAPGTEIIEVAYAL